MSLFLFPGQGSQVPTMGKDFFEQSEAARKVFDEAQAFMPSGFLETLFSGEDARLNQTTVAQPALLIVEVAIARHLQERGLNPEACAGHSLGEIPALVVAGACTFDAALRFTQVRARLMSENVPAGGMAAVMGLAPAEIEAALPSGVQVANYNGPSQTIISGSQAALEEAATALAAAGAKRVLPLKVSGPFHSEFMRGAAERFAEALAEVDFRSPTIAFFSSVTGQKEEDPETLRRLLSEQLYRPVQWTSVMLAAPCALAIEVGPGNVLRGLAKRIEGAPTVSGAGTWQEAEAVLAS